ncbi:hypothetical protein LSH36_497g02054 [Paralvinella palmiformis]|uniref:Proteasome subunit beta n=1 Tax=Paralvinella palmiformis TaxID=53620 RepID=A0AAD9J920_9ANNE|nr:hypothetical protein LSH36_497g02054 [Paralvinella palmiformis]
MAAIGLTPVLHGSQSSSSDMVPEWMSAEHSTGTTIMAVEYKDGVIVAADSRTTTGAYIANRVTDKLTRITDRIYCCRSGSAADTQAIADVVSYNLGFHKMQMDEEPLVKTAATVFQEMCYSYRDSLSAGIICAGWDQKLGGQHWKMFLYVFNRMQMDEEPLVKTAATVFQEMCYSYRDSLSAGIICAGWDQKLGGQVYSIPLGGMCVRQPLTIGGSGSTYIYGYVDSSFKEQMTKEECLKFCTNAVSLAMCRDGSSGGIIRLATISKDGVERRTILHDDLPKFYQG